MKRLVARGAFVASVAVLGGCVSPEVTQSSYGFQLVGDRTTSALGKETTWVRNRAEARATEGRVKALLAARKRLDVETAVQIALLNNKGLQASYADVGLSAADLWQESLLVNPTLTVGYVGLTPGRTIESLISTNLVAILTRQRRMDVAEVRLRQAQLRAVERTFAVAAETRTAWIESVAAWERVANLNRAKIAADAAADLASELNRTGSLTKAQQAREQAFYAELTGETASARLEARLAKERLVRAMGLYGPDLKFEVPDALPELPKALKRRESIETEALRQRVDLQVARLELDALARSYGLTKATRLVSDLELAGGFEVEQEVEEEEDGGTSKKDVWSGAFEVGFPIPIFDSGQARLRSAEGSYLKAANELAERAVNARSEARSAYEAYRSRFDIARHYRSNVVPLRTTVEAESLLTYNGMITSTFELLADTREKTNAVIASVDAKRAFWLADAGLTVAVYGGEGGEAAEPAEPVRTAAAGD